MYRRMPWLLGGALGVALVVAAAIRLSPTVATLACEAGLPNLTLADRYEDWGCIQFGPPAVYEGVYSEPMHRFPRFTPLPDKPLSLKALLAQSDKAWRIDFDEAAIRRAKALGDALPLLYGPPPANGHFIRFIGRRSTVLVPQGDEPAVPERHVVVVDQVLSVRRACLTEAGQGLRVYADCDGAPDTPT